MEAQKLALAHGEDDVHRVLADDGGQDPAVGTDDIPLGHARAADLAGDGCEDVGVAEIDPGGLEVGLVARDRALRLIEGGAGLIAGDDRAGIAIEQLLGPLQLNRCQRLRGPAALQCTLGLLDGGVEQVRLDTIELRPLLDRLTFLEQDVFEEAGHPRSNLDAADRLDATDEIECLIDGPALGDDGSDLQRSGGIRLRRGRKSEPADNPQNAQEKKKAGHGRPLPRAGPDESGTACIFAAFAPAA